MSPCCLTYMNKTRGHENPLFAMFAILCLLSSVCYVCYPLFATRCASWTWWSRVHQGAGDERAFPGEFKENVLSLYRRDWDYSRRNTEHFTACSSCQSPLSLAPDLNESKHVKSKNLLIRLRPRVSPVKTHRLHYRKDVTPAILPFLWKRCRNWSSLHCRVSKISGCRQRAVENMQYFKSPSRFELAPLFATRSKVLSFRLATYTQKAFTIQNA